MIDEAAPDAGGQSLAQDPVPGEDITALRAELQAREGERRRLEHELGVALEDRRELNRELEEARELLARLRQTLDAQERALRLLHASTSWRLTRPVRGMGGLARRLRRGRP